MKTIATALMCTAIALAATTASAQDAMRKDGTMMKDGMGTKDSMRNDAGTANPKK